MSFAQELENREKRLQAYTDLAVLKSTVDQIYRMDDAKPWLENDRQKALRRVENSWKDLLKFIATSPGAGPNEFNV